jgi:hypothetical protein
MELHELVEHDHGERNHPGLGNELIAGAPPLIALAGFAVVRASVGSAVTTLGRRDATRCRVWLGSLWVTLRREGGGSIRVLLRATENPNELGSEKGNVKIRRKISRP